MKKKKAPSLQIPLNLINSPAKVFTRNAAVALMHKERAGAFRMVAEFILKHKLSYDQVYELLTSTADEADAQAMVEELKDKL